MEIRTLADVASEVVRLTANPAVLARFRDQIAEFQRDAGRYIHEARVWEEWPSKLVRATKRGSRLRNYKAGAPTPHHTWWVAAVGGHGKPIVQFGAWIDLRERGPKPIDPRVPGWLPMDYGLCAAAHDHVHDGKGKRTELRLGHIVPDQYPPKLDAKLGVALASAQRVAWMVLKYGSVAGEDHREPTEQERVDRLIVALNHVRADLEAHGLGAAPAAPTGSTETPMKRPVPIAKAARAANKRPDVLLRMLRTRRYPIGGVKGALQAELAHVQLTIPRQRRQLEKWADKEYPIE